MVNFVLLNMLRIRVMNYGTGPVHKASLGLILCVRPWFHVGSRISINVFLVVETDWTLFKRNCFKSEECSRKQYMIYGAADMSNIVPACRGLSYRSSSPLQSTNVVRETCSLNGVLSIFCFLTLQTGYLFLWACFLFVFLLEEFCTQKSVRNERIVTSYKRTRSTSIHLISLKVFKYYPAIFTCVFQFFSCLHVFQNKIASISHILCVLHDLTVPSSSIWSYFLLVKGKIIEARIADRRGVYRVFVGRPDGKRPLGKPRRRWEDNIEMDLQEVGRGTKNWIAVGEVWDR